MSDCSPLLTDLNLRLIVYTCKHPTSDAMGILKSNLNCTLSYRVNQPSLENLKIARKIWSSGKMAKGSRNTCCTCAENIFIKALCSLCQLLNKVEHICACSKEKMKTSMPLPLLFAIGITFFNCHSIREPTEGNMFSQVLIVEASKMCDRPLGDDIIVTRGLSPTIQRRLAIHLNTLSSKSNLIA